MTINLNGQTIGDFLSNPQYGPYLDYYYRYHRQSNANGFSCGKTTMASSFALCLDPCLKPSLEPSMVPCEDHVCNLGEKHQEYYVFVCDSKATLNWKSNRLEDHDSGYDQARIVVLTSESANISQLIRYKNLGIPYLICGAKQVDPRIAMDKIESYYGLTHLLLEGGPTINTSFIRYGLVDELSLVVIPSIANEVNAPLTLVQPNDPQLKLTRSKKIAPGGFHLVYKIIK